MQNAKFKIFTGFYFLVLISLFFYSFTQVDLSLTLSRWSVWQVMEKFFQHIGYFQRSFSTSLFIFIFLFLHVFYILLISKKFTGKQAWTLVLGTSLILAISYNAFSYDLFNYIFDAKIVTHYHLNPYIHKALDFQGDPMLSFMHWTHRVYPYGPVWLLLTVPISFVGMQFFLPTIILFKLCIVASFVGTCYFLSKILRNDSSNNTLGIVLFALNPLVIAEALVSAHNDIVMMFFSIWALYLLTKRKFLFAILLLLFSAGIKFATIFLLPIFLLIIFFQRTNNKFSWNFMFTLMSMSMVIPIIISSVRTELQPWYLLWVFPFLTLNAKKWVVFPFVIFSVFLLSTYIPFLFTGNYNPPIPEIKNEIIISSLILLLISTLVTLKSKKYSILNLFRGN